MGPRHLTTSSGRGQKASPTVNRKELRRGRTDNVIKWTPAQAQALRKFVEHADSTPGSPPTAYSLARRAMAELVPGVVGWRSRNAVRQRIMLIRCGGLREEHTGPPAWTPAHKLALTEFVHNEKSAARALGEKPLSINELAHRALAQLVPAVLGPRSISSVWAMIKSLE